MRRVAPPWAGRGKLRAGSRYDRQDVGHVRKNLRQSGGRPHPCSVRHSGTLSLLRPSRRRASFIFQNLYFLGAKIVCFLVIFSLLGGAQNPAAGPSTQPTKSAPNSSPDNLSSNLAVQSDPPGLLYQGVPAEIPQDQGMAALRLQLLRLSTTARLMQVVAHPDDEDGGMLTLESRGRGVSVLLMTLNRGEGGQNQNWQQSVRRAGRVACRGTARVRSVLRSAGALFARRGLWILEERGRDI